MVVGWLVGNDKLAREWDQRRRGGGCVCFLVWLMVRGAKLLNEWCLVGLARWLLPENAQVDSAIGGEQDAEGSLWVFCWRKKHVFFTPVVDNMYFNYTLAAARWLRFGCFFVVFMFVDVVSVRSHNSIIWFRFVVGRRIALLIEIVNQIIGGHVWNEHFLWLEHDGLHLSSIFRYINTLSICVNHLDSLYKGGCFFYVRKLLDFF